MKCGVKFCGGCNPRYDRGGAYRHISSELDQINFSIADEQDTYDTLLVIGGCSACCASFAQYDVIGDVIKMWQHDHIDRVLDTLKKKSC